MGYEHDESAAMGGIYVPTLGNNRALLVDYVAWVNISDVLTTQWTASEASHGEFVAQANNPPRQTARSRR